MDHAPLPWTKDTVLSKCSSSDGRRLLHAASESNAQVVVDVLHELLRSPKLDGEDRAKYTAIIRKLCGKYTILPTSRMISEGFKTTSNYPVSTGGFADVYKGTYNGLVVAVKVFRPCSEGGLNKVRKALYREAVVWSHLSHTNVSSLLGATFLESHPLALVSIWMENGHIIGYTRANPQVNRLRLLADVATGVDYLHCYGLVHGDLKGINILINAEGQAVITDFGLTAIMLESGSSYLNSSSTSSGGSMPWMAPELIDPERFGPQNGKLNGKPTRASDIYALGMVIFEVLAGKRSFADWMKKDTVYSHIVSGKRPERPENYGLYDSVWEVVQLCWKADAFQRPEVKQILAVIDEAFPRWDPIAAANNYADLEAGLMDEADSDSSALRPDSNT